jgi:hypothetical protein
MNRPVSQQLQLMTLLMDSQGHLSSEETRQSYLHNMQQVTRYLFTPITKTLISNNDQVCRKRLLNLCLFSYFSCLIIIG